MYKYYYEPSRAQLVLSPHFVLGLCQHWRKVWLTPLSFWYTEKKNPTCLYVCKPITIVLDQKCYVSILAKESVGLQSGWSTKHYCMLQIYKTLDFWSAAVSHVILGTLKSISTERRGEEEEDRNWNSWCVAGLYPRPHTSCESDLSR